MRQTCVFMLVLGLAACGRGIENKDAVRQAVIDYLATRGNLNVQQMNVDVASVTFKGNLAEAEVTFSAKGGKVEGSGMTMRYTLEKQSNRWVVKGRADAGGAPHGGMAMPRPSGDMPMGHPATPAPEGGGGEKNK